MEVVTTPLLQAWIGVPEGAGTSMPVWLLAFPVTGCFRLPYRDKEFDETEVYKIVGSQEADPMNGVISEDSPFGKALLGKNAGDEVTVDAPAGPVEYKILKVER